MSNYQDKTIKEVLKGQSDIKTTKEVVQWFATEEGQDYLSKEIDDAYQEYRRKYVSENTWKMKMWGKRLIHYAAVLLPFVFLVSGAIYFNRYHPLWGKIAMIEIKVPEGESKQIVFQDGTSVYLGPGSTLSYPQKFAYAARKVSFSGEAYFDVASNKNWPFLITMPEAQIEVLGTSFNVTAYEQSAEINVFLNTGKIRFQTLGDPETYNMLPNESLVYNKITKSVKCQKGKYAAYTDWKNEKTIFDNTPLNHVLEVLKRKYDVCFEVAEPAINVLCYTIEIDFHNKSLEDVLKDLESITPICFAKKEEGFRVDWK